MTAGPSSARSNIDSLLGEGARGTGLAAAGGLKGELPNAGFFTLSAIFNRPT